MGTRIKHISFYSELKDRTDIKAKSMSIELRKLIE